MAFGELFSTLGSYRALDDWTQAMGSSVAGAAKVGFKANRSTFLGGTTYSNASPSKPIGVKTGEQTLNSQTMLDWSQGDLADTDAANNFAINGEGFFLVMDDDQKFYYTRGGDFTLVDGKLKTPQGLTVIDKTILETMTRQLGAAALPPNISAALGVATSGTPNYTGATLTNTDMYTATSPWVKPGTGSNGDMWLPFSQAIAQNTQYYEDPNGVVGSGDESYKAQGISLKTDFFVTKAQGINAAAGTSTLSLTVDNAGFAWVNGHQLAASDLIGFVPNINSPWGGYPAASNQLSQFDIGKYLTTGVNTIQLYAAEWDGGDGMKATANIALQTGGPITISSSTGNNSQWTTKLIGPDLDKDYYLTTPPYLGRPPSPPSSTYEDRMFNAESRDFVLAKIDYKNDLKFSKYGNTIFELPTTATSKVTLWEQGGNGVGKVQAGKLETANVDFDNIAGEMKMAEHMYDGLANILDARYSLIDTMFQYLIP